MLPKTGTEYAHSSQKVPKNIFTPSFLAYEFFNHEKTREMVGIKTIKLTSLILIACSYCGLLRFWVLIDLGFLFLLLLLHIDFLFRLPK